MQRNHFWNPKVWMNLLCDKLFCRKGMHFGIGIFAVAPICCGNDEDFGFVNVNAASFKSEKITLNLLIR
jgi:hypothetical protein